MYTLIEQEMGAAGELADWAYDLATYPHAITSLRSCFIGNPNGITEQDAWIHYAY